MPQISMRSWPGKVLALLGLLVVVPAWPIAKLAEGLAKRFRWSVRPSVLVFLSMLFVASLVLQSALGLTAAIALAFLLACVSPRLFALPPAPNEDTAPLQTYPRTTWRLCDPQLSTHGLWRAETETGLTEVADTVGRQELLLFIQELLRDWSFRSGWPYYHCRVLSATRSGQRTAGPFSSVADSSWVYRIRLDVGESGWVHFGDGYVEFQLEPPTRTRPAEQAPESDRLRTTAWFSRKTSIERRSLVNWRPNSRVAIRSGTDGLIVETCQSSACSR